MGKRGHNLSRASIGSWIGSQRHHQAPNLCVSACGRICCMQHQDTAAAPSALQTAAQTQTLHRVVQRAHGDGNTSITHSGTESKWSELQAARTVVQRASSSKYRRSTQLEIEKVDIVGTCHAPAPALNLILHSMAVTALPTTCTHALAHSSCSP